MIEEMKNIIEKYRSFIMYAILGVLTTAVNIVVYYLSYNLIGMSNVISTVIAWTIAVAFAFVTNKIWVFDSGSFDWKILAHEIPTFFGSRLITGFLDLVIMFFAVDIMTWNSMIWKIISNVIVIILNYMASRFIIFNKNV